MQPCSERLPLRTAQSGDEPVIHATMRHRPALSLARRLLRVSATLDRGEHATQHAAGGVHCVGEINDLNAHGGEVALQPHPLGGAAPVVPLEQDVEADGSPGLQFVGHGLGEDLVHVGDVRDDFEPFRQRNHGEMAFGLQAHLVRDHAGDQVIAVALGVAKDVQVPDVEEVVSPRGVSDTQAHAVSLFRPVVMTEGVSAQASESALGCDCTAPDSNRHVEPRRQCYPNG